MTRTKQRTSDTHRLKILARVVRDYRETQRQLTATLAQGLGAEELRDRRERLGRELDKLSNEAITSVTPALFDGCEGLPD